MQKKNFWQKHKFLHQKLSKKLEIEGPCLDMIMAYKNELISQLY